MGAQMKAGIPLVAAMRQDRRAGGEAGEAGGDHAGQRLQQACGLRAAAAIVVEPATEGVKTEDLPSVVRIDLPLRPGAEAVEVERLQLLANRAPVLLQARQSGNQVYIAIHR